MSYCMKCGTKLTDGVRFCTGCGTPISSGISATEASPPQTEIKTEERQAVPAGEASVQPQPAPPTYAPPVQGQQSPAPVYTAPAAVAGQIEAPPPAGSRYAPVSTGGFIGIFLLMLIPVVNLVLLIVWACGACRKVNQSNLAKAMLVLMLIGIVLTLILGIVFWGLFAGMGGLDGLKDSVMDEMMKSAAE